jgi:hypothetical protein
VRVSLRTAFTMRRVAVVVVKDQHMTLSFRRVDRVPHAGKRARPMTYRLPNGRRIGRLRR